MARAARGWRNRERLGEGCGEVFEARGSIWRVLRERAGAPSWDAELRLRGGEFCGSKEWRIRARNEAKRPRDLALEVGGAPAVPFKISQPLYYTTVAGA